MLRNRKFIWLVFCWTVFSGVHSLSAQDTSEGVRLELLDEGFDDPGTAESRIEAILAYAEELRTTDPSKAASICDKVIIHAISHELYRSVADAYTIKSQIKYYQSDIDSSLEFTKLAIDWAELEGDTSLLLSLYNNQGNSLIALSRYFEASEILTRTLSIGKRRKDHENVYKSLVHLVTLKGTTNDGEGMLTLLDKEKDAWMRLDERGRTRMIYLRALGHMSLRNFEQAKRDLLEVLPYFKQKSDPFMLMNLYLNASTTMMHLQQRDSAFVFAQNALEIANRLEDSRTSCHALRNLASIALDDAEYGKAEGFIEQARLLAAKTDDAKTQLWTLDILIDVKSKVGKWKEAQEATEAYYEVKDSLSALARTRSVDSLLLVHEVKEKKAELLKARQNEEIQRLKWQRTVFGFSVLTLLLSGLIMLIYILNKRRIAVMSKEREKQKQKLDYTSQELSDKLVQIAEQESAITNLKDRLTFLVNQRASDQERLESADIFNILTRNIKQESDWGLFEKYFKQANPHLIGALKSDYPNLTSHDLRLLALIRLNLSANEIAALFNITPESVRKAKYRLAKKLNLNGEKELHPFVIEL